MYTVNNIIKNELIIEKSRFITVICHLNNEDEVKNILKEFKKEYKHATHYCYAYIIDNIKRFNDDGEPTGTAGIPILNVLEKNNLTSVLCIVIRYFGGIKLGTGGLTRAYSNSVSTIIKMTNLLEIISYYKITMTIPYESLKNVNYLLKDIDILNKNFQDNITYIIKIKENDLDIIETLKEQKVDIINIEKYYSYE